MGNEDGTAEAAPACGPAGAAPAGGKAAVLGASGECGQSGWGRSDSFPLTLAGHHFLLEVVDIASVLPLTQIKYATDRCMQGWPLEKPGEAGVKGMPQSKAVVQELKAGIGPFTAVSEPSEACSDVVQLGSLWSTKGPSLGRTNFSQERMASQLNKGKRAVRQGVQEPLP